MKQILRSADDYGFFNHKGQLEDTRFTKFLLKFMIVDFTAQSKCLLHTLQCLERFKKIAQKRLKKSIFGTQLNIKWIH